MREREGEEEEMERKNRRPFPPVARVKTSRPLSSTLPAISQTSGGIRSTGTFHLGALKHERFPFMHGGLLKTPKFLCHV